MKRAHHHLHWAKRFQYPGKPPASPTLTERTSHRLKVSGDRSTYTLRKQRGEPVFGIIKSVVGFRQFLTSNSRRKFIHLSNRELGAPEK